MAKNEETFSKQSVGTTELYHSTKKRQHSFNCESAIGQHLIANPECAKTYTDNNFRIIGQARSSFHLGVLESIYIKTQNPVLCRQKSLFSHWDSSSIQC